MRTLHDLAVASGFWETKTETLVFGFMITFHAMVLVGNSAHALPSSSRLLSATPGKLSWGSTWGGAERAVKGASGEDKYEGSRAGPGAGRPMVSSLPGGLSSKVCGIYQEAQLDSLSEGKHNSAVAS